MHVPSETTNFSSSFDSDFFSFVLYYRVLHIMWMEKIDNVATKIKICHDDFCGHVALLCSLFLVQLWSSCTNWFKVVLSKVPTLVPVGTEILKMSISR